VLGYLPLLGCCYIEKAGWEVNDKLRRRVWWNQPNHHGSDDFIKRIGGSLAIGALLRALAVFNPAAIAAHLIGCGAFGNHGGQRSL
jgi:hypothetical protein